MAYKFTGDIALLFIVWVLAFGFLSVLAILEGYYPISAVLILGLIIGALTLLQRPDESFIENDRKKTSLKA